MFGVEHSLVPYPVLELRVADVEALEELDITRSWLGIHVDAERI
jgi:hypothetical protein